jgi:hypothetical protein
MAPRKQANLEKRAVSFQDRPLPVKKRSRERKPPNRNSTHFRFLDLSAELRNNIYDKVIEDSALVFRRSNANCNLASTSALARVSRSLRSEFLPLALRTTPVIKTAVIDWNFGHVVRFMNSMEDQEFGRFLLGQRLVVDFCFTGESADPAGLMRWLDRFDDDRRGDGVVFEYACTNLGFARQNWGIGGFRACTSGGPEGSVQFVKIAKVFQEQRTGGAIV